jgi:hypothetical protein
MSYLSALQVDLQYHKGLAALVSSAARISDLALIVTNLLHPLLYLFDSVGKKKKILNNCNDTTCWILLERTK